MTTPREKTMLLQAQEVAIARGDALIRIQAHCIQASFNKMSDDAHHLAQEIVGMCGDYIARECRTVAPEVQWKVSPREGHTP